MDTLAEHNPSTAEEVRQVLFKARYSRGFGRNFSMTSSLINVTMDDANYRGLKGEDLYTWLAWRALVRVEFLENRLLDVMNKTIEPTLRITL